jgi:hypothetical protein
VPLDYVGDLKWFARATEDTDLLLLIEYFTAGNYQEARMIYAGPDLEYGKIKSKKH